jgi:hypothetical protein
MTGNLLYRYSLDQIELEGCWSVDETKEKFSYLLLKKYDKLVCKIPREVIDFSGTDGIPRDYQLNICSANLHEAFLMNDASVFRTAIQFLNGEYHGFFMYYDKTIEDRFYLTLSIDDNLVRLAGKCLFNIR